MTLLTCGMENLELILRIIASGIERTFQKYSRNGQYMAHLENVTENLQQNATE